LWYYWRWKVESFFKLLKGSGRQVEHWQQENGRLILKRLLIASMAWRLAHSQAPQAEEARRAVMRLSGRQVEHGKPYTLGGAAGDGGHAGRDAGQRACRKSCVRVQRRCMPDHLMRFKGNRPSKRMAKWFNACFQPTIGIVHLFDASAIAR
jgi:hypothetical protein